MPKIPNPPVDELRDSFDLTLHEERVIYILTYQSRTQLPSKKSLLRGGRLLLNGWQEDSRPIIRSNKMKLKDHLMHA